MSRPLPLALAVLAVLALSGCNDGGNAPRQAAPVADGLVIGLPRLACGLESTWGASGHYTLADRSVTAMAADTQGRLLIAGSTATGSYVRRLTAAGALDTGFGSGGTLDLGFGDGSLRDRPVGLALGPADDWYLVVNHDQATALEAAPSYTLLHVLADGSVDPDFAGGGVTGSGEARTLQRLTFGQLVVPLVPGPGQWGLRQYSASGELDTALGTAGLYSATVRLDGRSGALPGDRIDLLHDCHEGNCDGWQSSFAGSGTPTTTAFALGTHYTVQYLSVPSPLDPGAWLRSSGTSAPIVTLDGRSPSLALLDENAVLVYPDGWVMASVSDKLRLEKALVTNAPDISFCDSSNVSPARSDSLRAGLRMALDSQGGIYTSSSAGQVVDTFRDYSLDADIFRSRGSAPDTTPADLATVPVEHFDADNNRYVMEAITISGLGNNVAVPARLLPLDTTPARGWELSVDGGTTWHNGWLWVGNDTQLMARRPATGRGLLTVGGVLSPDSPGVPVGNVLAVTLDAAGATVTNPSGGGTGGGGSGSGSSAGGGGGGALPLPALLALLGLGLWRLGRRRAATHGR